MKRIIVLAIMLGLFAAIAPATASAADAAKVKGSVAMVMGNKVHIFHDSVMEAKKEVPVGSELVVCRITGKTATQKEVGSVKVTGYAGDHYIEADILKGDIKTGDCLKKYLPPEGK